MKITRPGSEITVRNETDVLVIGAGPAGIGAAISAARAGAKVTLVEYGGKLGGMWTLGILSPFFDNRHHPGLNAELRTQLQERNAWGGLWNISFDPTQMALLLDELVLAENIDVLLYTIATEPIMDGDAIKGVMVANKSGTQAILAKVVIDCSGDGDIAARAGAPYEIGRPNDGVFQPMTMMFKIGGVKDDYPRDDIIGFYRAICKEVPEDSVLKDVPYNYPAIIKLPRPGEALIQWTHVRYCLGCDGDQLTKATFNGRLQVKHAMKYLQLIKPVLGEVYLLELPAVIGVRETRRITGEYRISDDDVKNGQKHHDSVCTVRFGVDIHEPDKAKQTCWGHPGFDIPYRALVPLKVENLLTAGRCISGSYTAHAAYRVTGNCLAMGEGAGKAAAEAVKNNTTVRKLCKNTAED
ncbi:MAG: FAD-dependent oxidoreductase [Lentisphaerae bacterium]|nr:FAD-dependent oxidoreductase [Lentisphaerota bacterium]